MCGKKNVANLWPCFSTPPPVQPALPAKITMQKEKYGNSNTK